MRKIHLTLAGIACIGMLTAIAAPAGAQSTTAPTSQDEVSQHHQLQYRMMKEMAQQMAQMAERMSHGSVTPDDDKKMRQQMERMSRMMRFMSGLAARPAHGDPKMKEQMEQMRAQMKEMMGHSN